MRMSKKSTTILVSGVLLVYADRGSLNDASGHHVPMFVVLAQTASGCSGRQQFEFELSEPSVPLARS